MRDQDTIIMSTDVYTLNAEPRDVLKKKVKQLRKAGLIPAAIFGYKGTFNVQVNLKDFTKLYADASHTGIVEVVLEGKKHNVIIDEVQFNPVSGEWTHASLREIRMDEEITAEIPFVLEGAEESPAVKDEESLVIISVNAVELRGLPRALPQEIVVNVSEFHAGDTITLKDVKLPEGVVLVQDDEEALAAVIVTTTSAVQAEIIENVDEATAEAVAAAEGEEGAEGTEGEAAEAKEEEK
jgi:large subunit ribosomal protein L25